MGRLIDTDDIKARAIEEAEDMEEPWHSQFAILVEWLVDETFTAYDTDKVVAELEGRSRSMMPVIPTHEAIDIVKRGGVE